MTQREAAGHFQINRSTLKNKVKGDHPLPPSSPRVLTEEEALLAEHCIVLSNYEFPIVDTFN